MTIETFYVVKLGELYLASQPPTKHDHYQLTRRLNAVSLRFQDRAACEGLARQMKDAKVSEITVNETILSPIEVPQELTNAIPQQ